MTEAELTDHAKGGGRGQGFASDSKIRIAVEKYAVDIAVAHFENLGWSVDPSPQKNKPYDLLCKRAGSVLNVEVKGTGGAETK